MRLDDGRVFADIVADVLAGRNIVMKSDGSGRRPFCYVADATVAFFSVAQWDKWEVYNVGSDREFSILELAETLCDLFPDRGVPGGATRSAPANSREDTSIWPKSAPWVGNPRPTLAGDFRRTIEK
jgi:nucleoside-diphosphate-sugar epimerase